MIARTPRPPTGDDGEHAAELDQPLQQGLVDRVPADGVAELVAEDEAHLLVVEQVDQRGADDDEGLVHADRHRVRDRVGGDVELGQLRGVEVRADLAEQPVQRS